MAIVVEDAVGAVDGNYRKWMECSRKRRGLFHLATARGKRSGKG